MIHKKIFWDTHLQNRKSSKNNKVNKILDLEKEKAKKGPEKSANFAKIWQICIVQKASIDGFH